MIGPARNTASSTKSTLEPMPPRQRPRISSLKITSQKKYPVTKEKIVNAIPATPYPPSPHS